MMWKGFVAGVATLAMGSTMVGADYYLAYKMSGSVKGVQMPIGASGYSKFSQSIKGYMLIGMTTNATGDFSKLGDVRILTEDSKTKVATEYHSNIQVFQKWMTDGKMVLLGGAYNVDSPVTDPIRGVPAVTGCDGSASYLLSNPAANKLTNIGTKDIPLYATVVTSVKGQSNLVEISTGVQNVVHSASPSYSLDKKASGAINTSNGGEPPATIDAALYALEASVLKKGYVTQ